MGLFDNFFGGGKNPAEGAQGYIGQIPAYMQQYYAPYMNSGQAALPQLSGIYQNMIQRPGGLENDIGAGYKQSPGFDFALKQALNAATHASAAGGMAGSPAHQQESMDIASGLASRDYNQWLQNAMGLYNQGVEGFGQFPKYGLAASSSMADQIAQALAQQANMQMYGDVYKKQQKQGNWGGILGGVGSLAGSFLGGPIGGGIGGAIGKGLGGLFG
jgi:hypothetical protein